MKKVGKLLRLYRMQIAIAILIVFLLYFLLKGIYGYVALCIIFGIFIGSLWRNKTQRTQMQAQTGNSSKGILGTVVETATFVWKLTLMFLFITVVFYLTPKVFSDDYYIRISELPKALVEKGYTKTTVETMFTQYLDNINNSTNDQNKLQASSGDKIRVEFFGNALYVDEFVMLMRKFFNRHRLINIHITQDNTFIVTNITVTKDKDHMYHAPTKKLNFSNNTLSNNMETVAFTAAYDALVYIDAPKIVSYYTYDKPDDFESLSHLMNNSDFLSYDWYTKLSPQEKFEVNTNYATVLIRKSKYKTARKHLDIATSFVEHLSVKTPVDVEAVMAWTDDMIIVGNAQKVLQTLENTPIANRYLTNYLKAECHKNLGNTEEAIAIYETIANYNTKLFDSKRISTSLGLLYFLKNDHKNALKYIQDSDHTHLEVFLALIRDLQGKSAEESNLLTQLQSLTNKSVSLTPQVKTFVASTSVTLENYPNSLWKGFVNMYAATNIHELNKVHNDLKKAAIVSDYLELIYVLRTYEFLTNEETSLFASYENTYLTEMQAALKGIIDRSNSEFAKMLYITAFYAYDDSPERIQKIEEIQFQALMLQKYKQLCIALLRNELQFETIEAFYTTDYNSVETNSYAKVLAIDFIREISWYPMTPAKLENFKKAQQLLLQMQPENVEEQLRYGSMLEKFNLAEEAEIVYANAKMQTNSNELTIPFDVMIAMQNRRDFLFKTAVDRHLKYMQTENLVYENIETYPYFDELITSYVLDWAYVIYKGCDQGEKRTSYTQQQYLPLVKYTLDNNALLAEVYEKEFTKLFYAGRFDEAAYFFKELFAITDEFSYLKQTDLDFMAARSPIMTDLLKNAGKKIYIKNTQNTMEGHFDYFANKATYACPTVTNPKI